MRVPGDYQPARERLLRSGCNGAAPLAQYYSALAVAANWIAGRRLRALPPKAVAVSRIPDRDDAGAVRWRYRYRTTGNGTVLRARLALAPAPTMDPAETPAYTWDGGAHLVPGHYRAPSAGAEEDVMTLGSGDGALVAGGLPRNVAREQTIGTAGRLALAGLTLWEEPRDDLDPAVDVGVDPERWTHGRTISTAEIDALLTAYRRLAQEWSAHYVAYSVDDPLLPHAAPAGLVNLFDPAVTLWGPDTPGWPLALAACNTASSSRATVTVQVYASCPGGTGSVKAVTSVDSAVAAVGAEQWYPLAVEGDAIDGEKLDILFGGDGQNDCLVWAVDAYVYSGP